MKKVAALALGASLGFLILEVGTRAFFALEVGPQVWLYGTDWYRNNFPDEFDSRMQQAGEELAGASRQHNALENREDSVERHGQKLHGYMKYFPGEKKSTRDVDTGERIPVQINRHGLRGPDFDIEKPEGVVRILTAGSSSTFGFYNRDHETYPAILARYLNESCERPGISFEVINFAIPHADSGSVAAMFRAEGLRLEPDVLTYYQGRNDSAGVQRPEGLLEKAVAVAIHRSVLIAMLDQMLVGDRISVTSAAQKLEPHAEFISRRYLGNLERIRQACEENAVELVVATQQATGFSPFPRSEPERLPLRGVTYDEEVGRIRAAYDRGEYVTLNEYSLLVHERLMRDLEGWAGTHDVPFVDLIAALDQDRHYLLSWVHLHPEANAIIARELGTVLLDRYCR